MIKNFIRNITGEDLLLGFGFNDKITFDNWILINKDINTTQNIKFDEYIYSIKLTFNFYSHNELSTRNQEDTLEYDLCSILCKEKIIRYDVIPYLCKIKLKYSQSLKNGLEFIFVGYSKKVSELTVLINSSKYC